MRYHVSMEKHAYTIEGLPPHRSLNLSVEQRRALAPLEVKKDVPGKGFATLTAPDGGSYTLYPERMNGDDPMCEIKIRMSGMTMEEAFTLGKQEDPEVEARRLQAISGGDLGSVWSQQLAIALLQATRSHNFDLLPETQLMEHGFSQTREGGKVWRKTVKGGFFTFLNKEETAWLMFEKNGKDYWHNLAILSYYQAWQDGVHAHPIFWPETVSDPRRAAVGLAMLAQELWTPDLVPKAGSRRKRSP